MIVDPAMSFLHVSVGFGSGIKYIQAEPADINLAPKTLHVVASERLLDDLLTLWTRLNVLLLLLPLCERNLVFAP